MLASLMLASSIGGERTPYGALANRVAQTWRTSLRAKKDCLRAPDWYCH